MGAISCGSVDANFLLESFRISSVEECSLKHALLGTRNS